MKISKFMTLGVLALSIGGVANAATTVHITGSTAFRKSTIVAIENLMLTGAGGNTYSDGSAISAGKFKAVYNASTSANGEQGDNYVILQGNIPGCNNPVTIKTAWAGSTGGLITTAHNIPVTWTATSGYLSKNNITAGVLESNSVGNGNIVGGKTDFTDDGDGQKADITMADSFQESAGITGLVGKGTAASVAGLVGIIPFEWVANNGVTAPVKFTGAAQGVDASHITYTGAIFTQTGAAATNAQISAVNILGGANIARNVAISSIDTTNKIIMIASPATGSMGATYVGAVNGTNPITNINQLQAQALLTGGGALLSQFTGVSTDNAGVYAMGRNFDSGTRLSELAETAVGVFAPLNAQVQPAFQGGTAYGSQVFGSKGKGGGADKYIVTLDNWSAETIFPAPYTKTYPIGQSGYNGGGDLADGLATPGSLGATATGGASAPLYNGIAAQNGGWLVGYLGRSDAVRAVKATTGANTAHRITWNGVGDWTGTVAADGSVTYDNTAVQEGTYSLWEYEFLYAYSGASGDQNTFADKLADRIYNTDAAAAGILTSTMNVSKTAEGQIITHN